MLNTGGRKHRLDCIFGPSFLKVSQRVLELQTPTVGSTLGWSQFTNRHNSINAVDRVTILNLFTTSDDVLYLYQVFIELIRFASEIYKGA